MDVHFSDRAHTTVVVYRFVFIVPTELRK